MPVMHPGWLSHCRVNGGRGVATAARDRDEDGATGATQPEKRSPTRGNKQSPRRAGGMALGQ